MRLLPVLLLFVPAVARADRHVIEKGETLQHVADGHGCSVEALLRANKLQTTLLKPGTVVEIPSCSLRARAQTRARTVAPRSRATTDDDKRGGSNAGPSSRNDDGPHLRPSASPRDKARAALAVIDGATWVDGTKPAPKLVATPAPKLVATTPLGISDSLGVPWDGELLGGEQLPGGDGYRVRRPELAYGVPYVVDHLRHSIAEVRALYPDVHTLAIGDISAEHGGKLAAHRSHQSGVDVDVGFYFKQVPEGYPEHFAAADDNLDLQATWALITAFARTTDLDDGVSIMFLDYAVQRRLVQWARKRGTPEADLEHLFQYPRGKTSETGLIRHWPNHADHVHVRFKSRR